MKEKEKKHERKVTQCLIPLQRVAWLLRDDSYIEIMLYYIIIIKGATNSS